MFCPFQDGIKKYERRFKYDDNGKITSVVEIKRYLPVECYGDNCPFYDDYNYRSCGCKRIDTD